MAILDDPEWLLKHIQHSFITSDDTGMCEMVIQDNDLMTLNEHKRRINEERMSKIAEKMHTLPEMIGRLTPTSSPSRSSSHTSSSSTPVTSQSSLGDSSPSVPSPEISSGWDFGVRRRSNTAQKLERIRKERQSRIRIQSIPWRKRNDKLTEEQISTMFEKKNLIKIENNCQSGVVSNCIVSNTSEESTEEISRTKNVSSLTTIKDRTESPEKHTVHYGFNPAENSTTDVTQHVTDQNSLPDGRLIINGTVLQNHELRRRKFVSGLAMMLSQSSEQYNNPFREYSKFNAQGHEGSSGVKKINIFIWPYGSERPRFPREVSVLANNAKVQDVIGLSCWQYTMENEEPKLQAKSVNRYSLYIAEDDGTVDRDFPALDPSEPFAKFGFPTLALVEKQRTLSNVNGEEANGVKESVFVKVNDHAGFSLISVDDLSVTMGEILKKTLKRRKGQTYPGRYRLEYQDKVGVAVNEEQTLESTGVMEFYLVREHSTRNTTSSNTFERSTSPTLGKYSSIRSDDYKFPPTSNSGQSPTDNSFVFVPTMEYQTFKLNQLHKVRSATPVTFGVGPNQIDVEPVNRRESRNTIANFLSPRAKGLSIRVTKLAYCALLPSKHRSSSSLSASPSSSSGGNSMSSPGVSTSTSFANVDFPSAKSSEKQVFKLYYKLSEHHPDFKHLTLEGRYDEVHDAVARVQNIMMLGGDQRLQAAFEARKFGLPDNMSSSSNSTTVSRKGSLFR